MLLVLVGLFMSMSVSFLGAGAYGSFTKHLGYSVAGCLVMFLLSFTNYNFFKKIIFIAFVGTLILMVLVLVMGHGSRGSQRWLGFGFLRFQPVELAKYTVVLFMANYYSKHKEVVGSFVKGILMPFMFISPILILVFLQPNYSALAMIVAVVVAMMFVAGVKLKYFIYSALAGIPVLVVAFMAASYRVERIKTMLDPFRDIRGDGYQVIQSYLAFYTGGFWGAGPGKSMQKLSYLPDAHNDFILSIIGEELGFFGILFVLILFFIFIYRGLRIAIKTNDMFGKLFAFGIVAFVGVQTVINMFVATGIGPVTGVPLPFVSYGGTALLVFLSSVGILLNISRSINK